MSCPDPKVEFGMGPEGDASSTVTVTLFPPVAEGHTWLSLMWPQCLSPDSPLKEQLPTLE